MSKIMRTNPKDVPSGLLKARFLASGLVSIEALAILAFLIRALLQGDFKDLAATLTLVVMFLIAVIWLAFVAIHLLGGKRWARSSAVFWQIAQLLLATESFTGRGASLTIGLFLSLTALAGLGTLFSKPMLAFARNQGIDG